MALTNAGFDGTMNELQYAQLSEIADNDGVRDSAAWLVTAGTGRQVSVAAGVAFAKGVVSTNTAPILQNLATPTNGQWFLITRHIDWAVAPASGVTVTAIAHTTTTTTVPTSPPTTFPTVSNSPGVAYDQELAWAWVNSVNTTVTLFDLRSITPKIRWDSAGNMYRKISGAWKLWETSAPMSYDPAWTNLSVGNGSSTSSYTVSGGVYTVDGALTFGSTTSVSGIFFQSMPTAVGGIAPPTGAAWAFDSSATAWGAGVLNQGAYFLFGSARASASAPWVWAVGDQLHWSISYVAA